MLSKFQIKKAINLLKNNKTIILPTDTIYGLSMLFNFENQLILNSIKKADSNKELIVLISDLKQLNGIAILSSDIIKKLNEEEPTTVIINGLKPIAVRLTKRSDLKLILNKVGPIFSTSVNFHNQSFLTEKKQLKNFNKDIKLFWDGPLNFEPSKIYNSITKKWVRK